MKLIIDEKISIANLYFFNFVASLSLRGNINYLMKHGMCKISSEHRYCVAKKPLRHLFCWLRPFAEEFFVTVSFDSVLQFIWILVSKLKFKHFAPSWMREWRERQQILEICDDYLCTRDCCDPLRDQMKEATASCTSPAKMLILDSHFTSSMINLFGFGKTFITYFHFF